jgi:hypothetical protein
MFTISIQKKDSISINYAVTMKRNFGCILRAFFGIFSSSLLSIVVVVGSSVSSVSSFLQVSFLARSFKKIFFLSCLLWIFPLWSFTHAGKYFIIVERRWKEIYTKISSLLLLLFPYKRERNMKTQLFCFVCGIVR